MRVLTFLTAEAIRTNSLTVQASSRDLAETTKTARRNVVTALDSLATRGLITTRQGSATNAAVYALRFMEVLQIEKRGGAVMTPPPRVTGATTTPGVVSLQHHPSAALTPPPTENKGLAPPPSRLDITPDSINTLDRVLTAKSAEKPRDELAHFAEVLRTMAPRLGRAYEHSPDRETCAQLMEACGDRADALHHLVMEIQRLRTQPGESPMWWVTVALQRFHGIPAKATAARRAEWKLARRPNLVRDRERAEQVAADQAKAKRADWAPATDEELQATVEPQTAQPDIYDEASNRQFAEGIAAAAAKKVGG